MPAAVEIFTIGLPPPPVPQQSANPFPPHLPVTPADFALAKNARAIPANSPAVSPFSAQAVKNATFTSSEVLRSINPATRSSVSNPLISRPSRQCSVARVKAIGATLSQLIQFPRLSATTPGNVTYRWPSCTLPLEKSVPPLNARRSHHPSTASPPPFPSSTRRSTSSSLPHG